MPNLDKIILNGTEYSLSGEGGLKNETKQALLQIAEKVAYVDNQGQTYYVDLYDALYAITAVSLNTNSIQLAAIGATYQLTATTVPAGGSVTWASSDTSVATVSTSGLVTAVALGNATITATAGSVSATCSVVVAQATCTGISAAYTQSGTVYDTDTLDSLKSDLVVTASWSNGTTTTLVDSDYTLLGTLEVGTSTITVSYAGQTATFSVTVSEDDRGVIDNIEWTKGSLTSSGAVTTNSLESYVTQYIPIENGQTISFSSRDPEWTSSYNGTTWLVCVFYKLNSSQAYTYIYPRLTSETETNSYAFECTSSDAVAVRIGISNLATETERNNIVVKVI